MGLINRLRAVGAPSQRTRSELPQEALDAATRCVLSGRDQGAMTRGRGSAHLLKVAGTQYRKEVITPIAHRYRQERPHAPIAAAIVLRDPSNPHDSNAVRVLIDGIHVGFLPRDDAAAWQPTLLECERRSQTLVGMVRFVGRDGWGLRLQLRDNLPGFEGLLTAAEKARMAKVTGEGAPVPLDPARLDAVTDALAVDENRPPITKQAAQQLAWGIRRALDESYGHAAALKQSGRVAEAGELLDLANDVENVVNDLSGADDAEEREDITFQLAWEAESLINALRTSVKAGSGQ